MQRNICRISELPKKYPDFPFSRSTLYKWKHTGRYPEIFIKISGTVLVDLDRFETLLEEKRVTPKAGWLRKL